MKDSINHEPTEKDFSDALQHINKTRIGRSIVSMDNRQLLAVETMFLFHGIDTLARIHGLEGNDLEYNLYTLYEISRRINFQQIAEIHDRTGNDAVILLLYSSIFKLIATEQIRKRFAERSIRGKSLVYSLSQELNKGVKDRKDFEDGENFLEDARNMTQKVTINNKSLKNITDQWRKSDHERIKKTIQALRNHPVNDAKRGLAGGDFQLEALDLYNKNIKKFLLAVDTGEFSNLPTTPASQYLPEPHPGWDEYFKKQLILQAEEAIKNGLFHLEEAEKQPFKILSAMQVEYETNRNPVTDPTWEKTHYLYEENKDDQKKLYADLGLWDKTEEEEEEDKQEPLDEDDQKRPYTDFDLWENTGGGKEPFTEQDGQILLKKTFSPKQQFDVLRIVKLSREKNPITGKKFTQEEIAKQIGKSIRTVRNLIKKFQPIEKEIKKYYRTLPEAEPDEIKSRVTDRTLTCPQCGTTFPVRMKKIKYCPKCLNVRLERGLTVNIFDPVTEEIKKTIRKKVKEKIDTSDD